MTHPKSVTWSILKQEVRKRWFFLTVMALYLGLGVFFTVLVYQFHWDQPATRWAARVFPLPAARVNGETIWLSHYYRRLALVEHYQTASLASQRASSIEENPDELRQKTLDVLIESLIFRQQAKSYDIIVTDSEITETYKKLAANNGGEEKFRQTIEQLYGLTPFQFSEEYIPEQLYREKLEDQLFTKVHPRWIIIEDEARSRSVLERAKAGEDFAELVKQFSQDVTTLDKGGDLGWLQRGQYQKPVEDVMFALKTGEVAPDLVKTDPGFVIIKVDERQDAPIDDLSYTEWADKITQEARVTRFVARPETQAEETPSPADSPVASSTP
jgi:parvulin-like peptidyl-prolyl isomerase